MASKPTAQCPHIETGSQSAKYETASCAECQLESPTRVCLNCGHVGCCDSFNGHATAHAKATGHPLIRSLPLNASSFTWCYECNAYLN
jgi:uncharacterized UBP type Zn finger protein